MKKKIETTTPTQAANAALESLITYAQLHLGTINALAERLTARTGQTVYRQSVGAWLNADATKRTEPGLGIGLLLIEEGRKLALLSIAKTDPGQNPFEKKTKPRRK